MSLRLCLVALISLVLQNACAEFFWRTHKSDNEERMRLSGGRKIYSSEVRINGATGTLSIFSFAKAAPPKSLGANNTRMILLPANGETLALLLEGSNSYNQTPAWPSAIPHFPATPIFAIESFANGVSFLTAKTGTHSTESAKAALTSAGFQEVSPKSSSCPVFTKGKETALVFAKEENDGCFVSVLIRKGAQ